MGNKPSPAKIFTPADDHSKKRSEPDIGLANRLASVATEPLPPLVHVERNTPGLAQESGFKHSRRRATTSPRNRPMSFRLNNEEIARVNAFLDRLDLSLPDALLHLIDTYETTSRTD